MGIRSLIDPKRAIRPSVYAYVTPTNTAKKGWVKIGYTERDADLRIKEQTQTAGIQAVKLWDYEARFTGGGYFNDHEFHNYVVRQGIKREKNTEWFYFNDKPERAKKLYQSFVFQDFDDFQRGEKLEYVLRTEQAEAVKKAYEYASKNPKGEFLWNAKPRFGKTLSSYDLVRKLDAYDVLVVTNRPAIANSWFDDFQKFIEWQTDFKFVSESDSLKNRPTLTRSEFLNHLGNYPEARQIAFISLQDLKGSIYFGGGHEKLDWVSDLKWDVLIIDEAHEGVDTFKTDKAFENIKRDFTLHLSGTPFKAISSGKFSEEQIFNWSYSDEQEAKLTWDGESYNPYENLPKLNMFTYEMSKMIIEQVNKGTLIDEREVDFAFDLNEFFATKENGRFEHEDDVIKWLDTLSSNEKYPFSTEELRNELKHTFWILHRVASAKALERLLKNHEVFKEYEIIIAAGDGKSNDEDDVIIKRSFDRVKEAIANNDKTITLSVGQLTTGVTIPEWSAVMMLSNVQSASLYMQAAFRSQNPHTWIDENDSDIVYRKENAYVFDFSPERTLIIFDDFANSLLSDTASGGGTKEERKNNVKRLLNFFPVIGEDKDGKMVELDASQVLTIPNTIKATEVVRRGFMSNLLFENISGIFQAPSRVLEILGDLNPEKEGRIRQTDEKVDLGDVKVDNLGDVVVDDEVVLGKTEAIFGNKVFEVETKVLDVPMAPKTDLPVKDITRSIIHSVKKELVESGTLENVRDTYGLTRAATNNIEKFLENEVEKVVTNASTDFNILRANIDKEYTEKITEVNSKEEIDAIEEVWKVSIEENFESYKKELTKKVSETVEQSKKQIVKEQEKKVETQKKNTVEEDVRSRLRGFARTIPSFLMAYGDYDLELKNFDTYIPENVFKEVTGITTMQFRFLRDGGDYEENGETKSFRGKLFNEQVFNQSVEEFLNKRKELANYFEEKEEDIFDYIPPQETNQIYTPKNIVKKMVDELEKETPGIYDDSSKTFIDIYMKSGLYITEIVKKLFNSEVIKQEFPNDRDRIKHILENQVYGFAPSEIIYNIAINFIFSDFDSSISRKNFINEDTTPYVKDGKLQDLVNKSFK